MGSPGDATQGDVPTWPMESKYSGGDAQRPADDIGDVHDGDETERTEPVVDDASVEGVEAFQLQTDRVDTAALESLFTERTEGDTDREEDEETQRSGSEEDRAGDETEWEEVEDRDREALAVDREDLLTPRQPGSAPDTTHETMLRSQQASRVSSPQLLEAEPSQLSPTRPGIPARPPRPTGLVVAPPPQPLPSAGPVPATAVPPPLQLITFDVGGKMFRCRASLVAKYPTKRLHRVVACGCEQIDHATFFIDRNPQHFERILDWYRTGKCARPLPTHTNEDALRDDAAYFDLLDEMFPMSPTPPTLPARLKSPPQQLQHQDPPPPTTALPRLPDRPPRANVPVTPLFPPPPTAPSPSVQGQTTKSVFRYSKCDVRVVAPAEGRAIPNWFCVRDHEHLIVESVKGSGRLLVRVTDITGMARVFVDQAVLFDSRSWFYLEDDGRARLQHCVLPGNHLYTFWMEPSCDQAAAAPSPPPPSNKATKPGMQKSTKGGPSTAVTVTASTKPPELEVVFRLVTTFSCADEMMESDVELAAMLRAKGKGWGDPSGVAVAVTPAPGDAGTPQCLFMPPRPEPVPVLPVRLDDPHELDDRDAIAEEIRALAAKERSQKTSVAAQDTKSPVGNMLQRGGVAIAQPQKKPPPPGHGNEKVTVYQPIPPAAATTPRSPAKQQPPMYSAQQPRQFRQQR